MKFECGDLEQALRIPELMPEAREHLKSCPACRREYQLWNEISAVARTLHEDWETPALWSKIRAGVEGERESRARKPWAFWCLAAAIALAALLSPVLWSRLHSPIAPPKQPSADRDFLTEQALVEVDRSEAAYRRSIDKLSRLADAKLKRPASPYTVDEQEKLLTLDSAIAETRANVQLNRFNLHLQTTLADLYREKQQTLEELLAHEEKN